jgi:hypothetical protein
MEDGSDNESEDIYPEEYDGPKAQIPRVDVPEVDVPEVDVPEVDVSSDTIADSPIVGLFVLHVIIWNAVLLCFSLGVMLIYFRQSWTTGGRLIGISIILTLYGAYRWPDSVEGIW